MSSELGAGRVSLVLPWLAVPHLHSNNPAASSSGRDFNPVASSSGRDVYPAATSSDRDFNSAAYSSGKDFNLAASSSGRDFNPAASSSGRDFTLTGDSPIFLGGDLPEIIYNFACNCQG